jgi:hypothetical protein
MGKKSSAQVCILIVEGCPAQRCSGLGGLVWEPGLFSWFFLFQCSHLGLLRPSADSVDCQRHCSTRLSCKDSLAFAENSSLCFLDFRFYPRLFFYVQGEELCGGCGGRQLMGARNVFPDE